MRVAIASFLAAGLLAGVAGASTLHSGPRLTRAVGPVPAHTTATSVTFVSTQQAYVLGTAPCAHRPCTVILSTSNRGATWQGLPAPLERVSKVLGSGLAGLRFADAQRGYAYGNGIWKTSDGANSWTPWSAPGRYVVDFAAVRDRELLALTTPCQFFIGHCANRLSLYQRPIAGGSWRRVIRSGRLAIDDSIDVHGSTVWVLLGQVLVVSSDGGRTFTVHSQPCAATPMGLPQPTSVADDGSHTYLMCTGQGALSHTIKKIYRTSGLHSGWTFVAKAPFAGDAGQLAAAGPGQLVLATASAGSWLYRSIDGGRHWHQVKNFADGGEGWGDLGFTTATDGVVIHGPAVADGGSSGHPGQLLLTGDGGRAWQVVPF